ncbi:MULTISPECIES: hypothetical protein [Sanguibacteroides]|uniref:hypothetical protein n=1 Tax=Sanguibacteroides TaxID=1635148 RepID=UPI0006963874|nr:MULTISPECIES: hypothetical protein [Sanguibacteroides]PXZ44741.1 hypothetical protein DMB45_04705 [Sanguibacteroides justesenii]
MSFYADLVWEQGKKNLPGLKSVAYFINKSKITAWPVLEDSENAAGCSTYKGDFTLLEAAKWNKVDVIQRKNSLTSEPQGERESTTVLNKLSVKHAGTDEEAISLQRYGNREDLVWLIQDMNSKDKFRVVGSEIFDTITKISLNLGSEATSEKATTIEVEATDECLPFYTGKIVTADGDINAPVAPPSGGA